MKVNWNPPLLLLHWVDASSGDDGWQDLEEFTIPDLDCVSVGWLVSEDGKQITLTATKGEHRGSNDFNGTITIPLPWIVNREILKSPDG